MKIFQIFGGDISGGERLLDDGVVMREGDKGDACISKHLPSYGERIGKDGDDAQDVTAEITDGIDGVDGRTAGGDKVFKDDDVGTGFEVTFDEVFKAVILRGVTNVNEGEIEEVGDQSTLGDGTRGDGGNGGDVGEMLGDKTCKLDL